MKLHKSGIAASTRAALYGTVAIASMVIPSVAYAQSAQDDAADDSNEIIVTATKREQTLQDVPVAVSVTSADTIERAQIRDIKDLANVVPSLRVSQLQSSANTNFFIRGFGNGANNAGIEPSVGLFVDGVYRSRSAAMIGDLPDISRVEVLRGPQSTLFGKNASAGIISFVTKEPQFDFGGNIEATYGRFNAVTVKGVVTGPITDNFAVSFAAGTNKRDGYVRDLGSNTRTNERDRWFMRGQFLVKPTDNLKMRMILDYAKIDENCCAVVNLRQANPGATSVIFGLGGKLNDPTKPFGDVVYNNFPSSNQIENWGSSGQIDWDAGPIKLTSITAWRRNQSVTNQDSDFSSADLLGRNYQDLGIKTFTQEFRLTSDFDGPLNFVAGVFHFDETIKQRNQLYQGTQFRPYADNLIKLLSGGASNVLAVEGLLGAASGNPGLYIGRFFGAGKGMDESYRLRDKAFSAFGQIDFEVTDRLTLTGGLNYTKDKKNFSTNVAASEVFSSVQLQSLIPNATNVLIAQGVGKVLGTTLVPTGFASPAQIQAVATGGFGAAAQTAYNTQVVPQATAGANSLLGLKSLQFLPPFLNVPNAVESGKVSDGDLSWTLRAAYDVNDAINVYVSYATGYKAASVNLSRDSRPFLYDQAAIVGAGLSLPNLTYGTRYAAPENSSVYEFGLKAKWGRMAAVNIAVFKQAIKGFQSNVFTGTGFALANAGKQSTWGVEFEGMFKPMDQLSLNLAATYLKPKYDDFTNSAFGDISGMKPAGVPPWSVTAGFTWDQPVGDNNLILAASFHHESAFTPVEGLAYPITSRPPTPAMVAASTAAADLYGRHSVNELDASLTFAMANGLELGIWGRNLTNDRYIMQIFDTSAQSGSVSGYPSQPRTYGVTARFKF